MKAVLLVAGLGTRLRPLTDKTPKCLLPLGGKPLLEIWLEKLEKSPVKEVLVNTHWLHDQVEDFIRQQRKVRKLKIQTFHEPELLGSAGTLKANKKWLNDGSSFFIIYGDNLTWVDLNDMNKFHEKHGYPVTLGVFHAPFPERCGIAEVEKDGTVSSFIEKPVHPKSDLAAGGIYIADQKIFQVIQKLPETTGKILDLGFHVFPKMAGQMRIYEIGELIDIGTLQAYEEAKRAWSNKKEDKNGHII